MGKITKSIQVKQTSHLWYFSIQSLVSIWDAQHHKSQCAHSWLIQGHTDAPNKHASLGMPWLVSHVQYFETLQAESVFLKVATGKVNFSPDKVQVIGISPDPVEKQKSFVEKEKSTVSLIP